MSDRHPDEVRAAMGSLAEYFHRLVAVKRAAPADDLMTALIAARDEHDKLSEKELINLCPELVPQAVEELMRFVQLGEGIGMPRVTTEDAQLARMELQEALRGLLRHMPRLRLAVPVEELRFKPGMLLRSPESLPVTW